jgi:hypothetical protein
MSQREALPKSLSFTPGFSLVTQANTKVENRFNGLASFARKVSSQLFSVQPLRLCVSVVVVSKH